eukprot:symbB.v1.2.010903.t1/scaffold720.1/size169259/14
MTRRLRQDSDEMKEEILRLERSCKDEEKAMTKTSSELQQSDTERRHLMQQLEISQNQLVELRMEYDMLQRESLFLQHEENNHSSEAQFLQRLLEEYQRDSKVIEESIGLLEDATFGLEVCASIQGVDGKVSIHGVAWYYQVLTRTISEHPLPRSPKPVRRNEFLETLARWISTDIELVDLLGS